MTWFLTLPIAFLTLIILVYVLSRRQKSFANLRSTLPALLGLFLFSFTASMLRTGPLSHIIYIDEILYFTHLGILIFALIFIVKFISFFLFDFIFYQKQEIKYPRLIRDIVVILMYAIGVLFILKYYFNIQVTLFLASSAVLTVVLGFALQDILGDLFFGIALNFEDSLKIGQWVKIDELEGKVEQLRWRSIKIRTVDNVLLLIPNQIASKKAIWGFGHKNQTFALRHTISACYKSSPDKVIATIMQALQTLDCVEKNPPPQVMVSSFGDFAIVYELRYFISDYGRKSFIRSEINRNVWYAFKRNAIDIPYPIREVFMSQREKDTISQEEIIQLLKNNEVLATIGEEYLNELVADVEIAVYGCGETIIREGQEGSYFHLILQGEVEVIKNNKVLARLGVNNYFGEVSLFTGDKTTADIRVSQELKVLKISSARFRETVKINKEMALKLSDVIASRRAKLAEFAEQEMNANDTIKIESETIFWRIKKYFGV